MGTLNGWVTRRRNKSEQEEFVISKAYNHGYKEGRQSLADRIGLLQSIAVTAERLCRVDGGEPGRMYDAQSFMEHRGHLHELITELRNGEKEGRWLNT